MTSQEEQARSVRPPPQATDAERSVLGCCIIDNACINTAAEWLKVDMFYTSSHQLLFEIILRMNKNNDPVDLCTIAAELEGTDELHLIGSRSYLAMLESYVLTTYSIKFYCQKVRDRYYDREHIRIAMNLVDAGMSMDKARIEATKQMLAEVENNMLPPDSGPKPIQSINFEVMENIAEKLNSNADDSMKIKWERLDHLTGGWLRGNRVVIQAATSVGKTALALSWAIKLCEQGFKGVWFNCEMTERQMSWRILSQLTGVPVSFIRDPSRMNDYQINLIERAEKYSSEQFDLHLDSCPGLNIDQYSSRLRRMKAENNIDFVVLDYIQKVSLPTQGRNMTGQQELAHISNEVGNLALELDVLSFSLSQVTMEKQGTKNVARTRGARDMENDADFVYMIERPIDPQNNGFQKIGAAPQECKLIQVKGRDTGVGMIPMLFYGPAMKYTEGAYEQ